MAAKKKYDPTDPKAKAARQKKIAAIGGVLLLALRERALGGHAGEPGRR